MMPLPVLMPTPAPVAPEPIDDVFVEMPTNLAELYEMIEDMPDDTNDIRIVVTAPGEYLVLLKGTALVSIIGLDDLVRKAALAAGATRKPFTFYLAVAIGFLVFTTVSVILLRWAERRYSAGFH